MHEEMPQDPQREDAAETNENELKEWFDAEDPNTGLMRRFKNIGDYMEAREQANDRDSK